jgi:hypothetical protein
MGMDTPAAGVCLKPILTTNSESGQAAVTPKARLT